MAPKKLFITGTTGYIGGAVLGEILKRHGQALSITALLRSPSREYSEEYPTVNVVKGSFDDFDVISKAASEADIVIHAGDIDHEGCAKAILDGVAKRSERCFVIHLSGTGCISDKLEQTWEGKYNPHQWHDIAEIKEIYDLPPEAAHHTIDQWFMDADNDIVKTAIICPPDIYGEGTGIGNRATFLVPRYVEALLEHKEAFYLGEGNNIRAVTHIDDVVNLFILILEKAIEGGSGADWGREGFYFAVSDSVRWRDAAEAIAALGRKQGFLPRDAKAVSWTKDQVAALLPDAPGLVLYLWGSNSRGESARARKIGWKPAGPSFWESLDEDCRVAHAKAK
ncbi:NAD(P)-binding protein [Rhizodiscina lignyota]|uniref:NAD(P)-binding protein n=1 Tax=Rhizodiscina lignyota TaxID=1504668 RepID=A0A9P4ID50_9PEZI|nr:NAD(P)-binding protein [Rhizodiscina lignyota]